MNRKRKKTVNKDPALDGRIGLPHTFDPINTSWKPTMYGAVLERAGGAEMNETRPLSLRNLLSREREALRK